MAGIFSLGRVSSSNNNQEGQEHNPIANQITPENWFWYNNKNDDVSYKRGTSTTTFELWQHQAELLHHQQRQQQDPYYSTTTAAGLGVGPSSRRSGINVVAGIGGGGISCQDCGNQAKKDCAHMRCRTCCKSRGFDCHTHVKSTWVPASKRRDKQQQQQQLQLQANKRRKENPSSSSLACSRLPSTNVFGFEVGNLPAEVSTEALFRCVKVCGIDDGEDQYAYQTSVNIGGHLFKGILYDQGPDESSSGGGIHEPVLNFINTSTSITTPTTMATAATTAADVAMASSSTAIFLDPSSLYPTPYTNFMATAGTQFFPNTRSS